eukprot:TRINITY_DN7485_c0_g1_i1.p1 TRINITY_DN7485_c0_g1~~TRINITY_DN7485_c0_g1_i1.p1  ORF type:complete len:206 (+),score=33.13 TRINITY_DN7485_c0_g1_i1:27-644(+)
MSCCGGDEVRHKVSNSNASSSPLRQPNAPIKVVLIGDSGVGKSSFLVRFTTKKFYNTHDPTIGAEFGSKVVGINGNEVSLKIWDTAGQEKFRSIVSTYYRGSSAAVIVYDVTRKTSFDSLESWYNDLRMVAHPDIVVVIVGNKCDVEDERQVTVEEGQKWADDHSAHFFEASCKTDVGITETFDRVAKEVVNKSAIGEFLPHAVE